MTLRIRLLLLDGLFIVGEQYYSVVAIPHIIPFTINFPNPELFNPLSVKRVQWC